MTSARIRFGAFALALALAGPAAAQEERTVFFALGSDRLDAEAAQTVAEAAADYAATGSTSISIVGHTDTTGSREYNQRLSQQRAETVRDALVARGVPEEELVLAWRGQDDLAVQTADNVAEPLNRRAEITLAAPAAPPPPEPAPAPAPARLSLGVGPFIGFNLEEGDNSWLLGGNLTASYFVTPNVALSAEQAVFYNLDAREDGWGGRTVAGLDYHFGAYGEGDRALPYVGVNAGYMYIDGTGTGGFLGGPEIGVKLWGVDAKIAYDWVEDRDWDEGVIALTVGYDFSF
jgi:hypothetical protein